MAIPKIIHQTYRSKELPPEIFEIVEGFKSLNPDWEYRFYTDEDILDYIQKNFDETILTAYLKINPVYGAAKADLLRKDNWTNYPARMCDARAFTSGAREIGSDITLGILSLSEMADTTTINYSISSTLEEAVIVPNKKN